MSKTLLASNDCIIIRPIEEGEQVVNNLIIPDMGKERPEMGVIISIGPGAYSVTGDFVPVVHQIGQTVVIPKIGSFNLSFGGEDFFVTRDKEILATVVDDGE